MLRGQSCPLGIHFVEPEYDTVYASAIFKFSEDRIRKLMAEFPTAIVGGTGIYKGASGEVHEEVIGNNKTGAFNLRFTFRIKKQSLK